MGDRQKKKKKKKTGIVRVECAYSAGCFITLYLYFISLMIYYVAKNCFNRMSMVDRQDALETTKNKRQISSIPSTPGRSNNQTAGG